MAGTQKQDKTIVIAPLVLLSVLDHYKRSKIDNKERVVGVLLGDNTKSDKIVQITNSYAVPFKENNNKAGSDIWFVNQQYIEEMITMTKKINAKERIVGWYHTGTKLRSNDLQINNSIFTKYVKDPILCNININNLRSLGSSGTSFKASDLEEFAEVDSNIPIKSYVCVEDVKEDGSVIEKNFQYLPSIIEAEEAEEIGVEHLLRNVKNSGKSELSKRLKTQLDSLQTLSYKLNGIQEYLELVIKGTLPANHQILGKLQDIFNLLPDLSPEINNKANSLSRAITMNTNDQMLMIHITQLVKAIIAFDDLIENKIANNNIKMKELKLSEDKKTEPETIKA
ncbi:26S proteasome regulatory subunit HuRPN8 [Hanseniaspora uvarum DSM 2768]|nr:26S proteasome regulatory subunit HuRPN8 [Hanseniaspora uvarum DSM 2768]